MHLNRDPEPPTFSEDDTVEAFERLEKLIVEAREDVGKAEGGNRAAGTRVRTMMQDIKNAAQEVRQKVLELRDAEKKA